jgi:hypothetical protein
MRFGKYTTLVTQQLSFPFLQQSHNGVPHPRTTLVHVSIGPTDDLGARAYFQPARNHLAGFGHKLTHLRYVSVEPI